MHTYYPSLQAIEQQTRQLESLQCRHCHQSSQLVSHGFVRKKRQGGDPQPVGKRVFCSNRQRRTGCGRTMQLYLDSTLRNMHYQAQAVVAFVLLLLAGLAIGQAYMHATAAASPRQAYRWMSRLDAQTSTYRSLVHQPVSIQPAAPAPATLARPLRRSLLASTMRHLFARFGPTLCQAYQAQLQRAFF